MESQEKLKKDGERALNSLINPKELKQTAKGMTLNVLSMLSSYADSILRIKAIAEGKKKNGVDEDNSISPANRLFADKILLDQYKELMSKELKYPELSNKRDIRDLSDEELNKLAREAVMTNTVIDV